MIVERVSKYTERKHEGLRHGVAAPFHFIAGIVGVLDDLVVGCVGYIIPTEAMMDVHKLEDFLDEHEIESVFISPKILKVFHSKNPALKYVITGSERLAAVGPDDFQLVNSYGMSEIVPITYFEVDRAYDNTPIGKPVPGVTIHLIGSDGLEAEEGEICVVAPHMTGSYYHLPEQNAAAFTPNPYAQEDGWDTMFHTHDFARRLPDGNILYLNRNDWMVKINGQRVETGEIEAQMRRIPEIADVAARGWTDDSGESYICAYYVEKAETTAEALRTQLSKMLPSYMVPAVFMKLDSIPANLNGKTAYKDLPKPRRVLSDRTKPETKTQKTLFDLAAKLLDTDEFGIRTKLLSEAGLSSIKTLQLLQGISDTLNKTLGLKELSTAETIEEMSALLDARDAEKTIEKREEYALLNNQEGILVDCLSKPDSTMYNIPIFIKLGAGTDPEKLKSAIVKAVHAHPYLFAQFVTTENGEFRQRRRDDSSFEPEDIEVVETADAREEALKRVKPFDLAGGERLLRAAILKEAEASYLLIDMHHLVSDGTSVTVLVSDISRAYAGEELETEKFTLYEAQLSEEARRNGKDYEEAKAYFDNLLEDAEIDVLPERDQVYKGETFGRTCTRETVYTAADKVRAFCGAHQLTENALFTTAFGYTLARFGNLEDVTFAGVYHGRNDARLSGDVGMFVRTMPIRLTLKKAAETQVTDLVANLGSQLVSSMTNDIYSFADACRDLGGKLDVMFVYQGDRLEVDSFCGEAVTLEALPIDADMEPLTMHVFMQGNRFRMDLDYDAERFGEDFIRSFLDTYDLVISEFLAKETLDQVALCSETALEQLDGFKDAEPTPVLEKTIPEKIREVSLAKPDKTAVVFGNTRITYRELDTCSDRIAVRIHELGIGREDFVSILVGRSEWMPITALGVLKSGAAYQPLDPTYPPERLNFMMKDAGAKLLIADRSLRDLVGEYDGEVLFVDEIPNLPEATDAALSAITAPAPEDAFIILYTSGTTGTPKGVVLEHRNLMNFCPMYIANTGMDEDSHIIAYASFGFDANMMDTYPTLILGAELHIIPEEMRLDLTGMDRYCVDNSITGAFMTTQIGRQFATLSSSPSFRFLLTGGESMVPMPAPANLRLCNVYGPTECSILSSLHEMSDETAFVPIGRPIGNNRFYVADEQGRRVPVGMPGELWNAGTPVGREYLGRPEKTAESFIENPFDADPEYHRVYRSGDIVRWMADGNIQFIGRRDGQVKIRGFRVELPEVEGVIREFPGITDATVAAFDEATGGKFIAAYVVSDSPVDVQALNAFILERKPPYMVPAVTMQLDQIPLNQNLKVNKRALPKPERSFADVKKPQNELQEQILKVVSEVIGADQMGVNTDFTEAGMTSIGAVKLTVALARAFDTYVTLGDLKNHSTVEQLEAVIAGQSEDAASEIPEKRDNYALLKNQEGIFVETLADPGTTKYNIPTLLEISTSVDTEKLKAALVKAVEAHPYLKTRLFTDEQGQVRQKRCDGDLFDPEDIPVLPVQDASAPVEAQKLIKPFDLMKDRLFRMAILEGQAHHYLLLDVHHIIGDGTSVELLLRDVQNAYGGKELTPEAFSLFEAQLTEEKARATEAYAQAKTYYEQLLDGAENDALPIRDVTELGRDRLSELDRTQRYAKGSDVKAFCESRNLGMNAFYNTAFGYTLSAFDHEEDIVYTTIYNGRNDSRIQESMGMFVRTLPMRLSFAGDQLRKKPEELVRDAGRQLLENMTHDLYSFEEISHDLDVNADVMFVYQGEMMDIKAFCGEAARSVPLALDAAKAPFMINVFVKGDQVVYHADYNAGLFTEGFMASVLECLDSVVAGMISGKCLAEIPLQGEEAINALDSFSDAEETDVLPATLPEIIRKQAMAHPEKTAVVYRDTRISYQDLDELSDLIAVHIHELGIGKEDFVSILIGRSEWMPITSLGVLKSGAAYQPLDPTYPPERLNFMIKDAGAKLLIADRSLRDLVSEYDGPVLYVDEIRDLPAVSDLDVAEIEAPAPENAFIILYTSGTTGTPKGVILEHRNLMNFCPVYVKRTGMDENSRIIAYASFGFDANMMDTYPTLALGAELHIIPEDMRLDLTAIDRYCHDNGITGAFMTTQIGRQFATLSTSPTFRCLSVGGEALVPLSEPVNLKLINGYGPTECTIFSSTYEVQGETAFVPIGRPFGNNRFYVVDEQGRRTPVGMPGELWIAGTPVGREYLGRPEKTAEVFVENPFDTDPKYRRVYRSGDIVRWMADGNIQFIGRRDSQVKIRGFRVELTEVEGVIREFPGIRDATVVAFDAPAGGKAIAAYVVSDSPVDVQALNAYILENKPPYMVPEVTMQIDRIPLNQNQKVNRKALPKPEVQKAGTNAQELHVTETKQDEKLRGIIAGIIGTDAFGMTEPLYAYGITSISSITLGIKIYKEYGVQLDAKKLAQMSMLDIEREMLFALMDEAKSGGLQGTGDSAAAKAEAAGAAVAMPDDQAAPLTYAQLGVYLECLKKPNSITYNVPTLYDLPSDITDEEAVKAVRAVLENHPALHVVFSNGEGGPSQRLQKQDIEIPVLTQTHEEFLHYRDAFVVPFDLEHGPLYRAAFVREGGVLHLFLDFHHLVVDGGSLDLMIKELLNLLDGKPAEEEEESLLSFAREQKAAEDGAAFREAQEFFAQQLKECEGASELPADMPKDDNALHTGDSVTMPVDYAAAEALAKKLGVTTMSIYLSAAYYAVGRFINDKQVYFGTISNGRSNLRIYNTVGMFVNTLVLKSSYAEESVEEFIRATAENFAITMQHEQYPFARIAADYDFTPHIMFEYQVGVLSDYRVHGQTVALQELTLDSSKFDLNIAVEGGEGDCRIRIGYDTSLYSKGLASKLAESVAATVSNFCAAPGQPVKHTSIMSPRQKAEAESFHVEATGPVKNRFFYEPLQKFAVSQPEKTALIAVDRTLTYAELNSEANRVAHALMERGIKRGDRVVVLLPRRSFAIICNYGVSKAGAAFIPCDPAYPADRISLILEDSGAPYVVTTSEHLAEHGEKAINIEDLLAYEAPDAFENPEVAGDTNDLAYMLYTSGSTGRPKGVMLRHEGICNYLQDEPANRYVHAMVHEGHRFLCITSLSFDMSMGEYGLSIFNGLDVVLASEEQMNNPVELARLIRETGADLLDAVPSRIQSYIEFPEFYEAMAKIKAVVCGGEPFSDKLLQRLRGVMTGHIFNIYGPTEITVANSGCDIAHSDTIHTGRPLYNYYCFVVDPDGNELPAGVVGELYIGGIGTAPGYNNLPELTAERFITYQGVRAYKSGDYAHWDDEGNIVIHGRLDNQIKLRGLRIELGEVESCITRIPQVTKAVVAVKSIAGKDHLAAYFTATEQMDIDFVRTEISKTLTPYMVPTAYAQLPEFPKTPNGKTDMKKLPEPVLAVGSGDFVAPRNETEKKFCEIFAQILGLDQVSVEDSFFDLGGTSLSVTQVIVEAEKCGFDLPYAEVFSHATPAQLAEYVGDGADGSAEKAETVDTEVVDFDYAKINEVLSRNTLEHYLTGEPVELGDVLVTGATGYLGIHVLHELLEHHLKDHPEAVVYALVRHGAHGMTSTERLQRLLFYYFEQKYDALLGTRLIVLDGDITDLKIFENLAQNCKHPENLTVINCAAIVKHFSEGTEIEDINIGGVRNCVDFCLKTGARFIQTSTFSISGTSVNGDPDPAQSYSEDKLYIGQHLDSKYTHSKFLAERIVLDAVATRGLKAKIMRLGNLSARLDGEFQINYNTNAMMSQLHAFQMLGVYGFSTEEFQLEFSPIDQTAQALLLLATTPDDCVVFHPFNNNVVRLANVIRMMGEEFDAPFTEVEDEVFEQYLQKAGEDPEKAKIIQSVLAYRGNKTDRVIPFAPYNPFTTAVLARKGFHWILVSDEYVRAFIEKIRELDFFEDLR